MTKLNKMNAIELEELKSYYYNNYSYDDLLMLTLQEGDKVDELMEELQRKDNIINELKKWLENYIQIMSSSLSECDKQYTEALQNILDKINELEGDNK